MSQIRNSDNVKVVTFGNDTRIKAERPGFDGVVGQISWDNASLQAGLREMFGCLKSEVITAIEITDDGIKAKFVRIP